MTHISQPRVLHPLDCLMDNRQATFGHDSAYGHLLFIKMPYHSYHDRQSSSRWGLHEHRCMKQIRACCSCIMMNSKHTGRLDSGPAVDPKISCWMLRSSVPDHCEASLEGQFSAFAHFAWPCVLQPIDCLIENRPASGGLQSTSGHWPSMLLPE